MTTALERLSLRGISNPAIAMLNQVLILIPNIIVGIVLILVGIWAGKWMEKLVSQLLPVIYGESIANRLLDFQVTLATAVTAYLPLLFAAIESAITEKYPYWCIIQVY